MVTMTEVPAGAEDKNRYKDVLPSEQCKDYPVAPYRVTCSTSVAPYTERHTVVVVPSPTLLALSRAHRQCQTLL